MYYIFFLVIKRQKAILGRYAYLMHKCTEQETLIRFYKNMGFSSSIDCTYYFDNNQTIEPKNKLFLTNLMYSSSVNFPEIYKIPVEFGFFMTWQKHEIRTGFVLGLTKQIDLPIIKKIDLKVLFLENLYKLF